MQSLRWCGRVGPTDSSNSLIGDGSTIRGFSHDDAMGRGYNAAFHPDDSGPLLDKWRALVASGQPGEIEARMRRHDGEFRWFLLRAEPVRNQHGRIINWYGVNIDIEDRKRAESLRAAETRTLEMIANGAPLVDISRSCVRLSTTNPPKSFRPYESRRQAPLARTRPSRSARLVERERELIEAALAQTRGRISGPLGAAARLGIPRQTLESKILSLRINKHRFSADRWQSK